MSDIISSFNLYSGQDSPADLAYDYANNLIYSVNNANVYVYTGAGVFVETWPLALDSFNNGCDLDADDPDILYTCCPTGVIFYIVDNNIGKYRISTKEWLGTTNIESMSMRYINGLAAPPGDYLWVGAGASNERYTGVQNFLIKVRKSDLHIVASYEAPLPVSGVAWDGTYLIVSGYSDNLYYFDPITCQFIYRFQIPGTSSAMTGLSFNGTYLLIGDDGNKMIYVATVDIFANRGGSMYRITTAGGTTRKRARNARVKTDTEEEHRIRSLTYRNIKGDWGGGITL